MFTIISSILMSLMFDSAVRYLSEKLDAGHPQGLKA